jgi:hypothetical protein
LLLVIVQVFIITEGQPVSALRLYLFQTVLDPFELPVIGEASCYTPKQADLTINLA